MACFYKNAVNVFVDCAAKSMAGTTLVVPAFITVIDNEIVNMSHRVIWDIGSNSGEVIAMHMGLKELIKQGKQYENRFLNLFSDSFVTVTAVSTNVFKWFRASQKRLGSSRREFRNINMEPVADQHLFIDIIKSIRDADTNVSIWHIKSHLRSSVQKDLSLFREYFLKNKNITKEDYAMPEEFLMEMCDYNSIVDLYSKQTINRFISDTPFYEFERYTIPKRYPLIWYPNTEDIVKYNKLIS